MDETNSVERHHVPDRIRVLALDAFGNAIQAEVFLATPHPRLGGHAPLEVAMSEHGAHLVEHLLAELAVQ